MRTLVALALALAIATALDAQTIRGTSTGTVTDSTGAVVPGANVVMTNAATGVTTSAVSNQQGTYTIPLLQPGTYDVSVDLQGFKKYARSGVVIEVAQTTRLDVSLQDVEGAHAKGGDQSILRVEQGVDRAC